ncbi:MULTISPECIES: hypothetical protein [Gammaproteobacteria]|uniref:hypothetical protein n=1 Tax=Gammaproteobacteria TaxID=1236 RepID=UPI001F459729|nr:MULTISPECIES: hypothetical protein [Gammaproteobacteria]MCF4010567.1 hypothetical protein [Rheinheimera sp. UJ63]MDP5032366.1 hypothetical protein [Paraglaciecola sp.]MDP5036244.1 hypothetical protein [Alishewanella sp.]MDP5458544.1 hypothetical protein [Alishewanella sp. SMS8]
MNKIKLFTIASIAIFILIIFDLYVFRPSGVYSYSAGEAYGFAIGMSKKQALNAIYLKSQSSVLKTREPFSERVITNEYKLELNVEQIQSDYWVIYESAKFSYLLIFKDEHISRILGFSRRLGELQTGLSLFTVMDKSEDKTYRDVFKGLNQEEIDSLILAQKEWANVYIK